MDRNIMDAASGGALVDKTPADARALIENMSINSQQFTTRSNSAVLTRGVNEIQTTDHKILENRLDELTVLVKKLATGQTARVCGICTSPEHPTDSCPTLQEDPNADTPQAYAANIFNPQTNVDLSSNRYHPSWRNHPNLRLGNPAAQQQQPRQQANQQQVAVRPEPSLEDLVKQMAAQNLQFQQRTDSSIQNLQTQIGQLATTINQMQARGSNQLPAQAVVNPNAPNPNVSAITLRSGKAVDTPKMPETVVLKNNKVPEQVSDQQEIPLPFPHRAVSTKKQDEEDRDSEILDTFRKVEVNIPLLEAIKQIPKYARFLKELCTYKRKKRLKGIEKVNVGYNVSALMLPMPQKCKDPGTFSIPCTIGNNQFDDAMLDLGASINVMPTSIFDSLALGPLQETGVTIQLANRSNARPVGLVEDVLVKVNNLIFPADFYILDMEEETKSSRSPIILGRPFLRTAKTKIDVHAGTLSMEFGDKTEKFNIFNAKKNPMEEHSLCKIELLDGLVDTLQVGTPPVADVAHVVAAAKEQPLVLELKPPPKNFNFAYSDGNGKLHETNITELKSEQEEKSPIPRKHRSSIGLTMAGIPAKKVWKAKQDKMISKKEFSIGHRVLWFRPRLKLMVGKHQSKWIGPFVITNVFPHGAVEIKSEATNKVFKVNGQRLKLFHGSSMPEDAPIEELSLEKPTYSAT